MHATCFRPISVLSLDRNPFRVFRTLLRSELLFPDEARNLWLDLLGERKIFADKPLGMLRIAESQNGRHIGRQAEMFVPEALLTFTRYNMFKAEHPILADIDCFQSAHINHLTPRTVDISAAQVTMQAARMAVKSRIEGPPRGKCHILLRQTSFLALEEAVRFRTDDNTESMSGSSSKQTILFEASHKACFGEILSIWIASWRKHSSSILTTGLSLRKQGLIYCESRCAKKQARKPAKVKEGISLLEQLIAEAVIDASPITYEDLLPISAGGIFQSNLQSKGTSGTSLAFS
ncbi:hypothetical protein EDB80DRAFT_689232 [Ilyonectria destructans]|nr:hypothetical protein EDB80DRAFT_689232 [Ilyonectria destructans]